MKQDVQFQSRSLSASEYALALHEPEDQVAVLLANRHRGQTLQRIASAASHSLRTFRLRRVLLPGSCRADSFRSSQQRKGGNNARGMG